MKAPTDLPRKIDDTIYGRFSLLYKYGIMSKSLRDFWGMVSVGSLRRLCFWVYMCRWFGSSVSINDESHKARSGSHKYT